MAYQVASNVIPSDEVLDMLGDECQVHIWSPNDAHRASIRLPRQNAPREACR